MDQECLELTEEREIEEKDGIRNRREEKKKERVSEQL